MSAGHYIEYCKECKTVIASCRCPSKDKEVRYGICTKCAKDINMVSITTLGIGTLTADFYKCRYCNNDAITRTNKFCSKCGILLDWTKCDE